jgi:hypothetical protein
MQLLRMTFMSYDIGVMYGNVGVSDTSVLRAMGHGGLIGRIKQACGTRGINIDIINVLYLGLFINICLFILLFINE